MSTNSYLALDTRKAISRLNVLKVRAIAWLLLLLILVSVGPINVFHQHLDEHLACDISDEVLELDPCHVRIFHPENVSGQCEHPTHLDRKAFICKICEFARVIPVYVSPTAFSVSDFRPVEVDVDSYFVSIGTFSLSQPAGRGPPIFILA